jgi:hypothetical protein
VARMGAFLDRLETGAAGAPIDSSG